MSDSPWANLVNQVEIQLNVADQVFLHLVMTRNGMVNRRGNGQDPNPSLVMGRPGPEAFEDFLSAIPTDFMEQAGRYTLPDQAGDPSSLVIHLSGDAYDNGFAFAYGSESMGPPTEFVELVELALELTEEWYQGNLPKQQR